ncbi:MAG: dihydrodipicolinate synthase family protein [Acidimicrobiia bacterium]|nr:dihydrodipicolinate synthase family protein [Acidimicrobiia bacterium]
MPHPRRDFLAASLGAAAATAANKLPDAGPRFLVAALTMIDKRGQFDEGLQRDYLAHLQKGGADGALILGTTGEFPSFSIRERKQVLESSIKHKGKLEIMAHVGTSNLPETLELIEHAAKAGAGSALVLPPYYFKNPTIDGLAAFYEPVLRGARVPVLLYNIPQLSGAAITPELITRLSTFENLAGMKDSFSKIPEMTEFIRRFPKMRVLTGVPGNMAANLAAGGAGAITGNGSVLLGETSAVFAAHAKGGDVAGAQRRFDEAARAFRGYAGVPAMKFALSLKGLRESGYRPPLLSLTEAQKSSLRAQLGH